LHGAIAASLDALFLCESVRSGSRVTDFRVIELNRRGELMLARPRTQVMGHLATELAPMLVTSGLLDRFVEVAERGGSFEDERRFEDLPVGPRWMRLQVVRVQEGIAVTVRDITKRKTVEESLRASEERFRHLVESATDGIYRIDPRGIFTYANPIASRLLGLGPEEPSIVGRLYLDFVRPDYRAQGMALYRQQIIERIPVTYWEFPAITADGRELWIGQNVQIEEVNGWVTELFAVARDITVRKVAEIALRESEQLHRFLAEHSTDVVARVRPDGMVFWVSPVCEKLLGYKPDELIGRSGLDHVHPDDIDLARRSLERVVTSGGVGTTTMRVRRADGRYVWFEATAQAVSDPRTGVLQEVLTVSRDITERRRLDEELRQAQKMEAVGQLAGGVAHDFNNILTVIRGFGEGIERTLALDDPRRRDVAEIIKATEHAAALTQQLLAFSRRQVLRLETLSLNAIVKDMVKILRRLLGESVRVATSLESALWTTRVDPGQIEHVLLKLALTARAAMPHGGTFEIETRNVVLENENEAMLASGRYVVLVVRDSGAGMSEAMRSRIFDPFFTRRDPTDHADLGLAAVYGIITQSGGHIAVASTVDVGTTFTIHLPTAESEAGASRMAASPPRSPGGNTVLVAEDNDAVRVVATRVLESAGYTVLVARDGIEAVELLRARSEPIDLLITDLTMPRICGSELATLVARMQPGAPSLFITGFMEEQSLRQSFESSLPVLQKPFSGEELIERVQQIIGAAA
jgi:PAS domain S-box-containing protein